MWNKLFVFDIVIHITFLYLILYIFFTRVGIKKEGEGIINNIQENAQLLINNYPQLQNIQNNYRSLPDFEKKMFKSKLIQELQSQKYLQETENKKYEIIGFLLMLGLFLFSIGFGYYLHKYQNIKMSVLGNCVFNNFILFIAICSIEVLFFFTVIMHYIPIDKKEINTIFINEFNKIN